MYIDYNQYYYNYSSFNYFDNVIRFWENDEDTRFYEMFMIEVKWFDIFNQRFVLVFEEIF